MLLIEGLKIMDLKRLWR